MVGYVGSILGFGVDSKGFLLGPSSGPLLDSGWVCPHFVCATTGMYWRGP